MYIYILYLLTYVSTFSTISPKLPQSEPMVTLQTHKFLNLLYRSTISTSTSPTVWGRFTLKRYNVVYRALCSITFCHLIKKNFVNFDSWMPFLTSSQFGDKCQY